MALAFEDLQLNPKLLQALHKKGFANPTNVQATCIPEALLGKDLVAQARTGTGKTLAYVLPALHRILAGSQGSAGWQALVLVPTRELCEQASMLLSLGARRQWYSCLPLYRVWLCTQYSCKACIMQRLTGHANSTVACRLAGILSTAHKCATLQACGAYTICACAFNCPARIIAQLKPQAVIT